MGMCKSCGTVVSSAEMKEGFCKDCFSPDKVEKTEEKTINKRPLGITIVSTLQFIGGFIMAALGIFSLFFTERMGFKEGLILLVVGVTGMLIAVAIRKGKPWARVVYTVLAVFGIVFSLVSAADRALLGKDILNLLSSMVFIVILFLPSSNEFFETDGTS